MPDKIANIARNTSYFTLALIFQKVISFTYFTILARNLIPEDLGKYYFALSFTAIFAVFIDIGLANVQVREVAKDAGRASQFLSAILHIKIPLAVLSSAIVLFLINIMDYPEITRQLVYLSTAIMLLDSFTLTFYATIRGFHNLLFESIGAVIFQAIALVFGIYALKAGLGLKWIMGALMAASIFNFVYSAALAIFKFKLRPPLARDREIIKFLLALTIPFGLYNVLQKAFLYLDTVMLSILAGDRYVGLYQIAFKIIFALQFLPMAFVASLYPAFSSYWKNNRDQLAITFERAMNYLIVVSLPISIGIIVIADNVLLLFKSEYMGAIIPLRLIMISLVFVFINFPIGSLLNACDRQIINTRNMGITLFISIALNIVLIPLTQVHYNNGAIGASITVVVANFIMFVLGAIQVPQVIVLDYNNILNTFLKTLAAAGVMAYITFILKDLINIFIVVAIAGSVYFTFLLIFGGIKLSDIASIYNSFFKRSEN